MQRKLPHAQSALVKRKLAMNNNCQIKVRTEKDVRRWVRKQSDNRVFWVEHGAGGLVGIPDCWIAAGRFNPGIGAWVELKAGDYFANSGTLKFDLRPTQVQVLKRMVGLEVSCGLLVGIRGEIGSLIAMKITPHTLGGCVDLSFAQRKGIAKQVETVTGLLDFIVGHDHLVDILDRK